jgi:septal ring factor EnvC (AmiA/AmiB activator)
MKLERTLIFILAALFLAVLLAYARFNHMEQRMTGQRIENLNLALDSLIATIKNSDARYKSYTDEVKNIQDRVELMENEKRELIIKLDNMNQDLAALRSSLAATNIDSNKKIVELGQISVKKSEKAAK